MEYQKATYTVKTNDLEVSGYQSLRRTTLWKQLPDHLVKQALSNDLFSVSVYKGDILIGMGRVIGDDSIYYYVQDVVVHTKYRGKGVGNLIMHNIEQYLKGEVETYAFIGLMAAKDSKGFYQKFGYRERDNESPGMYKVFSE
ncbi:GNAT family N-acetyltransferase [Flagellimonas hymeniacidonis]|uniref:GNAT family N-acetyltransferase n=1 Tax=Flagellimonas hymeniacidonis TaxID=2603628 RepID=UPI00164EDBB9|nr:GNAT family N-acetyltransferase [Flagellimonas hymeniacidonis]